MLLMALSLFSTYLSRFPVCPQFLVCACGRYFLFLSLHRLLARARALSLSLSLSLSRTFALLDPLTRLLPLMRVLHLPLPPSLFPLPSLLLNNYHIPMLGNPYHHTFKK